MESFLETETLVSLAEIRQDRSLLPKSRGLYGLFFKSPPGATPTKGCYVRDGSWLLYIGTAGAGLGSSGNLRNRLGSHHLGGNERRSTVCQTLAALLPDVAGPALAKSERGNIKFHTSPEGILQLRAWMDHHIFACWTSFAKPADLEAQLIRRYNPPLNLEFSDHPFAPKLAYLRSERRSAAT